jgi:uncharacterized MAPEG superfamily protein
MKCASEFLGVVWVMSWIYLCGRCVYFTYIFDVVIPSRSVVWTGEVLGIPKVLQAQLQAAH